MCVGACVWGLRLSGCVGLWVCECECVWVCE
jgi:hypothetical protein